MEPTNTAATNGGRGADSGGEGEDQARVDTRELLQTEPVLALLLRVKTQLGGHASRAPRHDHPERIGRRGCEGTGERVQHYRCPAARGDR